ncbi:OLC1v1037464C1 [Oldenlandia corymbosa var. corymbosa]|uniref:OLC1v1037464C1 n=1 Tax=Oldenlandia corymbosa var. corymbosa TaxID=529605 RepID=A0AAV1E1E0_OLDCO|nr:OLC1v1037464C1 [Oldenlandia corymbosa var. corymbosa]
MLTKKMTMMRAVVFVILCVLTATTADEIPSVIRTRIRPSKPLPSFKVNTTQPAVNQGSCAFTISVRTSCQSVRYTRDRISIAFGDAYGNQVYAPRLDDPRSRTFESCSTDTFQVYGPCTYQICYLYLYRSGRDGWRPYDVTIYGSNTRPVTFHYDDYIPRDTWFGFNYCSRYSSAAKSAM